MRHEATRAKVTATLRLLGHKPPVQGGNGKPLPKAQALLAQALSWPTEVVVNTPRPCPIGLPTSYKIDIADTTTKVAIEVDGASHCALTRQAEDRKKENVLREQGWLVLRFKNRQVLTDLPGVVLSIRLASAGRAPILQESAAQ